MTLAMRKKILFVILVVFVVGAIVAGLVFTKKAQFQAMAEAGANGGPPPSTVSVTKPKSDSWDIRIAAVGSIEPIRGIRIETEAAGRIEDIHFENGQYVDAGQPLVQMDVDAEKAELRAAEATKELARTEYQRAKRLRESGNIPQSQLDRAVADLERAAAEIENIKAIIDRKTIEAPFAGRVGIRQVNPGQFVPIGTPIVSLQDDERVYVNCSLPQKSLSKVKTGMTMEVRSDAFPKQVFTGALTAISPEVDPATRSVDLQGTVDNPEGLLRSGLFVDIELVSKASEEVLLIPATAIIYAPYGNSVYLIEAKSDENSGEEKLVARQTFIRIGRTRGDLVDVTQGLEPGQRIVSAGAFKLKNGDPVKINNDLAPEPKLDPEVDNS